MLQWISLAIEDFFRKNCCVTSAVLAINDTCHMIEYALP